MNYLLKGLPAEDTVQLLDNNNNAVVGLSEADVKVYYRKDGDAGYTLKVLAAGELVDRGAGIYTVQFSATELDKEGLFRYYVAPAVAGTFQIYFASLYITTSLPSFPQDPPTINAQTDSPPGITPDPVFRGDVLTINGTNLDAAITVKVGGNLVSITANTSSQIQVTIPSDQLLGADQVVEVTTPGGTVTSTVEVVLAPSEIPGSGLITLTGVIFSTKDHTFKEGVSVYGRVLDMPNISMGVGWTDEVAVTTTNSAGEFALQMPRNVRVEISIPEIQYYRQFITPDAPTKDIFREIP